MSSPKIIIKSGYIKDIEYFFNSIEYAGNKIDKQTILFNDGSRREVSTEERILLSEGEQKNVRGILIQFKDGGRPVLISYAKYRDLTEETQDCVRVNQLTEVMDEEQFLTNADGKQFHAMKDLDFFKYLSYIEARPGVEKVHGHGLFGLTGYVSIEDAKAFALEHEKSIMWSHIVSMPEKDSQRLGYDNRAAWANLVCSLAPKIAKAYNISLNNLVINAAYHTNTDNDHCHLLFYSTDPREGFVKGDKKGLQKASETLKSLFTNEIYHDDLAPVILQKNDTEQKLEHRTKQLMEAMQRKSYAPPLAVTEQLLSLSDAMVPLKGKRQYGYLPAGLKEQVNTILKTIVSDDKYLQVFYNEYMDINRELVSSYYADPKKIDARMKLIEDKFFNPDKKNKGSTQLQNIIVKYAAALADASPEVAAASSEEKKPAYGGTLENASSIFEGNADDSGLLNDELPIPDVVDAYVPNEPSAAGGRGGSHGAWVASSEEKKQGYRKSSGNARENEDNPMARLSQQLHKAMTDDLKASADGPLTTIHEALSANSFKEYVYAPFEAKQQINEYIAAFINQDDVQEIYRTELVKRVNRVSSLKQFKDMPLEQLTLHLEERFIKPDEYTSKQLHDQVLRFAQRIDQHRFVEDNRSRFFFSLKKEAFADSPDKAYDDLFYKLRAVGSNGFSKMSSEIQQDINVITERLLTKNNLPTEMIKRFVPPDDFTPLDFQNTIFRFVRVLDRQREVHKLSGEFFRALREDSTGNNEDYRVLHEMLKPLEAKGYHELPEVAKAEINRTVGHMLNIIGADPDTVEYFSHPTADTPTGLHRIVYFYLKRLDLQEFATNISIDFSFSLKQLVTSEKSILDDLFEKLQLADGAHYQELPEELQKEISKIVGQLLIECKADTDIAKQFETPDSFTPLSLHEQVFRMAKRPEQYQWIQELSEKFYSSLQKLAFDDSEGSKQLHELYKKLSGIRDDDPYSKLSTSQRQAINQLVAMLLKENKVDEDMIRQLTEPDELTPMNLQHTVFRFVLYLPQHRFIHDFSSSFLTALRDGAFAEGILKEKLQELNRQLARLKETDIPLLELPVDTKALLNDVVTTIFRQHNIQPEVLNWFVPYEDGKLPAFHNMVRGFAAHYYEHQYIQTAKQTFYRTLTDSTLPKHHVNGIYAQLASIRDRLTAYSDDVRYNDLDEPLKADIIRLAYSALQSPAADPNGVNTQAVFARKLLLDKDAPKDFQNTIIHIAKNLNELSRKTAEFDKKRRLNAVINAVMMCRELATTLNQMSEQDAASVKNYSGEQERFNKHRTFHRRKVTKHENYTEY